METLAPSETLEKEDSVIFQLDRTQNPSVKTLEQVSGLSNGSVPASEISVKENGVSEKDIVTGTVKVFKQTVSYSGGTDKGSFAHDAVFEESLPLSHGHEVRNEENVEVAEKKVVKIGDPSLLEVILTVNADKVSKEVADKIFEVSGSSISLFDQVFGPSDDHVQADDTEHVEIEAERGNKVEGDTMSVHKSGEFSAVGFEPKDFLGHVKDLAKDVSGQTTADFTVTQNRLSAYYKTLGHQQLPMDQLVPSNQERRSFANETISNNPAPKSKKRKRSKKSDDIVIALIPEKGHESRERRKSKYLSPPYVNLIGSGVPKGSLTMEEHEIDKLHEDSGSVDSYNKKLQARSKKHLSGPINESSAELLSLLQFTALDCCCHDESKIDLVERYFLGFRKSAYQNILFEETAEENLVEVTAEKGEKKSEEETSAGSKKPKKRQVKVTGDLPDLNQSNNGLPVESPKIESKKRKRNSKSKTSETILPNLEGSKAKVVPVGIKEPVAPLDPNSNQQKDPPTSSNLPDLNGNTGEDKNPKTKRRKKETGVVVLSSDFDYSKLQLNGDAKGTALLLKFSPESPLPSKESLVSTFSKFGELQESETQVLNESYNAQILFLHNSNARDAFRSLANSSPFGPSLINYRLLDLSATSAVIEADINTRVPHVQSPPKPKKSTAVKPKRAPVKAVGPPVKTGGTPCQRKGEVAPDIAGIKKRLEMMTAMMEQAGDSLPAETRAKLENDIKGLLAKVSSSG